MRLLFGRFQQLRGIPRLLYLTRRVIFPPSQHMALLTTPAGIPLTIDRDDYGHVMQFYFPYCPELLALLHDMLSEGDVCLDLGANNGLFAFVMSGLVGERGAVVAVEPNPHLSERIQHTIHHAALHNIQVLQCGVAGSDSTARFSVPQHFSASGQFHAEDTTGLEVPLYTIQTIAALALPERAISFIKYDIEGLEAQIIESLQALFASGQRPMLLVEFHPQKIHAWGRNADDLRAALRGYGYLERHILPQGSGYQMREDAGPLQTNGNMLFVQPEHLATRPALNQGWQTSTSSV